MATLPTTDNGMPTTPNTSFFTFSCNQCLIILFSLAFLTAFFMVLCLLLSFKLARSSQRPHLFAAVPSAPAAMELWASPPISHSQITLLLTEASSPAQAPDPDPLLSLDWEWEEAIARQPRVTLQDIDRFWWRSNATAV